MKRAATRALDHVLVSLWTFLGVFLLFGVVYLALPRRWQSDADIINHMMHASTSTLCLLSTTRYLSYWDVSQWLGLGVHATTLTVLYLLSLGPTDAGPLKRLTPATFTSWALLAVAAPLMAKTGWVPRIRWPRLVQKRGDWIRRQQELRAAEEEAARLH